MGFERINNRLMVTTCARWHIYEIKSFFGDQHIYHICLVVENPFSYIITKMQKSVGKKENTVNSGIEARLLSNFWTFEAVLYSRVCQFLLNKSLKFCDFFILPFETVFYSKQFSIPEFAVFSQNYTPMSSFLEHNLKLHRLIILLNSYDENIYIDL